MRGRKTSLPHSSISSFGPRIVTSGLSPSKPTSAVTASHGRQPSTAMSPLLRRFKIRGPAPEIDYETTIPEPLELSLSAEDIFLLGETCGSEVNEEVTGDGNDCSNSDSGSTCVAEGMDYSSDEQDTVPTNRSIGVQTDECDSETTTTFSSFLCHMTRDGVATEVAHKAADSVLPATPSSPRRKSRSRYITYIVY
uniref:52 kD repressor of inhibitor of protein kinase n=1 Tax=Rhipicephalus zambeziensis TaxID=60191 RepID=A0A224YQB4_9ACAR